MNQDIRVFKRRNENKKREIDDDALQSARKRGGFIRDVNVLKTF